MRKTSALFALAAILTITVAGCSENTRRDIKSDVNETANDLNRKAQDALD